MPDPIRVLHFADVHIGMENYGKTDPQTGLSSRVVDFLHQMDRIIAHAKENEVDLVVFAGDAFKTRTPNPTYQREFAHRIQDLAELAPVLLLVGNHDVAPMAVKASSIEIYDTLRVPNVWVAGEYKVEKVDTKRGPVIIGTAPYPIRSRILEHTPTMGLTIQETDAILMEKLTAILDELAEEADKLAEENGDADIPRLLTGHFTVLDAMVGSERAIMLGRDIKIPKMMLADARWDYVALGHIHKHQNLTAGRDDVPPVVYSGSIERIDFGEEGDDKGFCWVELARKATQWQFIDLPARPFVTIDLDLTEDAIPTKTTIHQIEQYNLKNAVVRLRLKFSPESEAKFNEAAVREALRRAGAFYIAAIGKDIEQPARIRLGKSPEGLTHMELLERFLVSKEIPQQRRAELLETALQIIDEVEGKV
jgi:DNA repair protein SbcD/Mre11